MCPACGLCGPQCAFGVRLGRLLLPRLPAFLALLLSLLTFLLSRVRTPNLVLVLVTLQLYFTLLVALRAFFD